MSNQKSESQRKLDSLRQSTVKQNRLVNNKDNVQSTNLIETKDKNIKKIVDEIKEEKVNEVDKEFTENETRNLDGVLVDTNIISKPKRKKLKKSKRDI